MPDDGDAAQAQRPRYPTGFVTEEAQTASEVRSEAAPATMTQPAPAKVPAAATVGLPKVRPFELPVAELAQVAEVSGLQWVNSDAQKIAAVQAAIAAEPKPPRLRRERPPAIVVDEGPLVLVETRRDLRDMRLPFEQSNLPLQ